MDHGQYPDSNLGSIPGEGRVDDEYCLLKLTNAPKGQVCRNATGLNNWILEQNQFSLALRVLIFEYARQS